MTKEQERQQLHSTIWAIANDLRGSVSAWDFKKYIFGFLFHRYISEDITSYINKGEWEAGKTDFDYQNLNDTDASTIKDEVVKEKGYFMLPSHLFANIRKTYQDNSMQKPEKALNEKLEDVFIYIENSAQGTSSESDFKGLLSDVNVNSEDLGGTVEERNKKLYKIIDKIGSLNLGNFQDNTIDVFGDAYEFLMRMYAANGGKSGGEFYTPQEVGELLAKIVIGDKKQINKVYDPACGSGGLLLKFAKILGKENIIRGFYGQEINRETYNLCRINMILHNVGFDKFDIAREDTLINPKHWDEEPFDAIVSNPPYGIKWDGDNNPTLINDTRFAPAGVLAPKSNADLAFTMHMLSWLSNTGTAAIVEFPGVLYRGGAEEKIRHYLIENNFIDCVIQLPKNLFFGTGIATCIIVLKKNKADNNILFIDASNFFIHEGNKNKLSDENIANICAIYKDRKDIENTSAVIPYTKVLDNQSYLSVSSYVESKDEGEKIHIEELLEELDHVVDKINTLRQEISKIVKEI